MEGQNLSDSALLRCSEPTTNKKNFYSGKYSCFPYPMETALGQSLPPPDRLLWVGYGPS